MIDWVPAPRYAPWLASKDGRVKLGVYTVTRGQGGRCYNPKPLWGRRCYKTRRKTYFQMQVSRKENGNVKTAWVHRIVADAFHGQCPDEMEVMHIDENPANNASDNLRYGTRAENTSAPRYREKLSQSARDRHERQFKILGKRVRGFIALNTTPD